MRSDCREEACRFLLCWPPFPRGRTQGVDVAGRRAPGGRGQQRYLGSKCHLAAVTTPAERLCGAACLPRRPGLLHPLQGRRDPRTGHSMESRGMRALPELPAACKAGRLVQQLAGCLAVAGGAAWVASASDGVAGAGMRLLQYQVWCFPVTELAEKMFGSLLVRWLCALSSP